MPTALNKFHILSESDYKRRGVYLWRYFDLHKFYSFLKTKDIRFTRMDEFEDPLEGIPLRALLTYVEEKDSELIGEERLSDLILDKSTFGKLSPNMQNRIKNIKAIQRSSNVSCWFLGNRESMAMWNLYSNEDGVAIKVQASLLIKHFKENYPLIFNIGAYSFYGGKVHYQDFKSIIYEKDSPIDLKVGLRKDVSYRHEEEFRFVIRTKKGEEAMPSIYSRIENLADLNMKVICHPAMPGWKRENIMQMLRDENLERAFALSAISLRKK